jgi:hypothetical protein
VISKHRVIAGLSVVGACVAIGFVIWKITEARRLPHPVGGNPAAHKVAVGKPVGVGLDQVLKVLGHGGTPLELEDAIGFLDTVARHGKGLAEHQRAALLAALERGTPTRMADGSWSHIFNSACNALATAQPVTDERLLSLLERVAVDDPRLVMRLYALQHIDSRYDASSPASRQRLRDLVQRLLADPTSKTAGTALVLWRRWEKTAGPGTLSSLELSRAIAADAKRPVDVRVTALHAIGDDPRVLDLARTIAPDRSQPLLLRKAALNLIGRHGEEQDLAVLQLCGRESPRLAQAGDPAARSLKDRLAGHIPPVLQPY